MASTWGNDEREREREREREWERERVFMSLIIECVSKNKL